MANYPQELAQDAVCPSHTGHTTGLWFLPTRPLRPNTNERMNIRTHTMRCRWLRGQRRGCAAARLLGLRVRIPPKIWNSVSIKRCVFPGTGICNGLITRAEQK